MENINRMKETLDAFLEEFAKVDQIETMSEVSAAELSLLHKLQLLEVEVAYSGSDLRTKIVEQTNRIRSGEAIREKKPVEKSKTKTTKK